MEYGLTTSLYSKLVCGDIEAEESSQRLERLLQVNSAIADHKRLYPTEREAFESQTMRYPLGPDTVFPYFGLMLGSLPPASIFIAFTIAKGIQHAEFWPTVIMSITTFVSSVVGYYSGILVGKSVKGLFGASFSRRTLACLAIGILWGISAGAAGGLFIFIIGAFFGAVIGGLVGAVSLTAFSIPYFALKRGGMIELSHFLPLSLGITFSICAFVLGFLVR